MFILPIGNDRGETWRRPVVTIVLASLAVLAFFVQLSTLRDSVRNVDVAYDEAVQYLSERPWLEPDERLQLPEYFLEEMEYYGQYYERDKPFLQSDIRKQQEELERLTEVWVEARDSSPMRRYAFLPADPSAVSYITYQFMHGGWFHLIGNLLLLFALGSAIEDVWGRPVYLAFYLLAGICAAVVHAAETVNTSIPVVGASGSIAGLMGVFMVRFWTSRIRFAFITFFYIRTFFVPAYIFLPVWILKEWGAGRTAQALGTGTGVAHWAHVGGFVFGALVAAGFRTFDIEKRFLRRAIAKKVGLVENPAVEEAYSLRDAGQLEEAWTFARAELAKTPQNFDLMNVVWQLAQDTRRTAEAFRLLVSPIRLHLGGEDADVAADLLREISEVEPELPIDRASKVLLAEALGRKQREAEAQVLLSSAVDDTAPLSPALWVRLVKQLQAIDPQRAVQAAEKGMAEELPDHVRRELERLRSEAKSAPMAQGAPRRTIEVSTDAGTGDFAMPVSPDPAPAQAAAATAGPAAAIPMASPAPAIQMAPAPAMASAVPTVPSSRPTLRVLPMRPLELQGVKLAFEQEGKRLTLQLAKVAAISGAQIGAFGQQQILDLMIDPPGSAAPRLVRLDSTTFDPAALLGLSSPGVPAFLRLAEWLCVASGGVAFLLPSLRPLALPSFPSVEAYEAGLAEALCQPMGGATGAVQ